MRILALAVLVSLSSSAVAQDAIVSELASVPGNPDKVSAIPNPNSELAIAAFAANKSIAKEPQNTRNKEAEVTRLGISLLR